MSFCPTGKGCDPLWSQLVLNVNNMDPTARARPTSHIINQIVQPSCIHKSHYDTLRGVSPCCDTPHNGVSHVQPGCHLTATATLTSHGLMRSVPTWRGSVTL